MWELMHQVASLRALSAHRGRCKAVLGIQASVCHRVLLLGFVWGRIDTSEQSPSHLHLRTVSSRDVQLERAGSENHERGQVRFNCAQFGHYLIELGLAMCLGSRHELHAGRLSYGIERLCHLIILGGKIALFRGDFERNIGKPDASLRLFDLNEGL